MKSVLIVDDEPLLLELIKEELSQNKTINVDYCTNAFEAIHKIATKNYDVVICDQDLKGEEGITVKQICKENNINPRFILISGNYDLPRTIEDLDENNFMCKPFDVSELEHRILFDLKAS